MSDTKVVLPRRFRSCGQFPLLKSGIGNIFVETIVQVILKTKLYQFSFTPHIFMLCTKWKNIGTSIRFLKKLLSTYNCYPFGLDNETRDIIISIILAVTHLEQNIEPFQKPLYELANWLLFMTEI